MNDIPKRVPPVTWLIAAAARNFPGDDPTQPRLHSGLNYVVGVLMVHHCIKVHAKAKALEAKYR